MDKFDDLDELVVDDELDMTFTAATNYVQSNAANLHNNFLLPLYGYYKQGLEGKCNTVKPSWYDMKGKAKWEAWNKLGDMPPNDAKVAYIEIVRKIDPNFTASGESTKTGWVTVSTLQHSDNSDDSDKTLIDYIKDGDYANVLNWFEVYAIDAMKINSLDNDGLALIHWAADRGSVDILKLLLSYGANIFLCDTDGQTPLHYAVSCGHISCIEFLLDNGADATIKDSDGLDCFAAASDECVKSLLETHVSKISCSK